MRKTPLLPLRLLPPGITVQRCEFCRLLTMAHELCASSSEAALCPPKSCIDGAEHAKWMFGGWMTAPSGPPVSAANEPIP